MIQKNFENHKQLQNCLGTESTEYAHWDIYNTTSPFIVHAMGITYPDPDYMIIHDEADGCLHRMFVVEYICDGIGTIETKDQRWELSKGDTVFHNLNRENVVYSSPEQPYQKRWINFSGTLIPQLAEFYAFKDTVTVAHSNTLPYFEAISAQLRQTEAANRAQIMQNVFCQLIHIFNAIAENRSISTDASAASTIKNIIDNAPYYDISLAEIAETIHYSERHIARVFSVAYGVTPKQYILQQKIKYAQKILTRSNASNQQIALQLHFHNTNHFTTTFQRFTGETPEQYRNRGPF